MTRTLGHSLSLHSLSKTIAIMRKKTKFKIGEFSQLMQITVKTLRHYEQKGLLMPDDVDEWTGYRYYSIDQMQKLNSIRSLQRRDLASTRLATCIWTIAINRAWLPHVRPSAMQLY